MRLGVIFGALVLGLVSCATMFIPLALRKHALATIPQPVRVPTSVWALPLAGGAPQLVAQLPDQYDFPVPSVDGRSLLMLKPSTVNGTTIWSVPLDGGAPRQIGRASVLQQPAWSPDRKLLATTDSSTGLELRDLAGKHVSTVIPVRVGGLSNPSWSGGLIAFERSHRPVGGYRVDLEVWRTSGQRAWRVEHMSFGQSAVALAPDGRRVAVVEIRRLVVVTSHTRRLLATDAAQGWAPLWTPDGRKLVYVDTANRLVVQDVATGSRRFVAAALRGVPESLSRDGRTVYVTGAKPAVSIPK